MKHASFFIFHFSFFIIVILMTISCAGDEHSRVRKAAERSYEYLQKGKYEKFVNEIAYADAMSDDYRSQMVDLIKDYAASQELQHGKIIEVEATNDTIMDAQAHVYLQIQFADSTSEEVGVPMVKVGKRWKMQ